MCYCMTILILTSICVLCFFIKLLNSIFFSITLAVTEVIWWLNLVFFGFYIKNFDNSKIADLLLRQIIWSKIYICRLSLCWTCSSVDLCRWLCIRLRLQSTCAWTFLIHNNVKRRKTLDNAIFSDNS
jgi:hypothetical protein